MLTATYIKLAASITRNARTYKTKKVCELAIARVKAAEYAAGSWGNLRHHRDDAIWACQDRWQELDGLEREARFAVLMAS